MLELDPRSTALVLIDLQNGILAMPVEPRSAADVLAAGRQLAARFRAVGAPVVLVHVGFAPDGRDAPPGAADQPMQRPAGGLPPDWSDLAPGLREPSDIVVFKRNWGAFHGTDLDLHLRRRGIRTIVLGGIATNFGVESTARDAWERGYGVVIAEDATASRSGEMHAFAVQHVFPRISRVRPAAEIGFGPA